MSLSSFSNSFEDSFSESSYDSVSDASYDSLWTTDSDRWSPDIDGPSNLSDGDGQTAGTGATNDEKTESSFHRFSDLSAELRHLVWEQFCPELCTTPVILPFKIRKPPKLPRQPSRKVGTAHGTKAVEDFASRLRILVTLHRESRMLAVNRFPDTLRFRLKSNPHKVGSVRFDKQRDIVFIKSILGPTHRDLQWGSRYQLPDFGQHVHRAAFRDLPARSPIL